MAPIGDCWATGSWADDTWAAGTWATRLVAALAKSRFFKRYVLPHGRGVVRRA